MKTFLILAALSFNLQAAINFNDIYIVKKGFDSNDNIEATVFITLPDACKKVESVNFEQKQNKFVFSAKIKERKLEGCNLGKLNFPFNHIETISLGKLSAGHYQYSFETKRSLKTKSFEVKKSQSSNLDDYLYAPVSNIFTPELAYTNQRIGVILDGMFYNSCYYLNDANIEIQRQENIFIIQPKLSFIDKSECIEVPYPLQSFIELPAIESPGSYLLHVRSQSGLSVNRVFHVFAAQDSPSSSL